MSLTCSKTVFSVTIAATSSTISFEASDFHLSVGRQLCAEEFSDRLGTGLRIAFRMGGKELIVHFPVYFCKIAAVHAHDNALAKFERIN